MACAIMGGWKGVGVGLAFGATVIRTSGGPAGSGAFGWPAIVPQAAVTKQTARRGATSKDFFIH